MPTIKNYRAVSALNVTDLNTAVNALINQGWEPLGGIAVSSAIYKQFDNKTAIQEVFYSSFAQAIVQYKP